MTEKKLVLIDGSYYLYRAYHAMGNLSNANGEPSGAIYGVINMLHKHLKEPPDYFVVVFDPKGKTTRNDLYHDYKANRPPTPDDLVSQIKPLHNIIRAKGFSLLVIEGIEADDVIATLARKTAALGIKTVISTGDKDLAQIVNDRIHLINTMSNTYLDREGVVNKYGVLPEQIIDYLTLIGDTIDNIPGVPKVGPKTAVKWLSQYGSLTNIIDHADEIKGKVGESLRGSLPQLPLSKKLVTLNDHVELDYELEQMTIKSPDLSALKTLYSYWGFKSWLAALDGKTNQQTATPIATKKYETILTAAQLDNWLSLLDKAEGFAVDTETTSLDYMQAAIVGISLSISEDHAAYIPLQHDYDGVTKQLALAETLEKLKPFLEDPAKYKVGHNLKYDKEIFANYNIHLNGIKHDTMLASYVVNSTACRHDMDSVAAHYLNIKTIHYEDVAGKGAKQIPFNKVNIDDATAYAAEDVDVVLKLQRVLSAKLQHQEPLKAIYDNIEIPLLNVLARIERNGVCIDSVMLMQQGQSLDAKMQQIEITAHNLAGESFNISSPKQIQRILYDKLKLDQLDSATIAKTPSGQRSTAESVLQALAEYHELPQLILKYRHTSKLRSTYTEKLPQMINQQTGRVHTSYHQAIASTGRLSCSEPNLQNIPIRTNEGRKIRQAFIAPEGYTLVAADYSQIELRIMAHLSADRGLFAAFANGQDIHKTTAAEVFAVPIEDVSNEQRRAAKAINFGLIYGMSAFGLAKQLKVSRGDAQQYVHLYFERYPDVKAFMDNTRLKAKEQGYVETVYGRRLYLPEIRSRNAAHRQYAERTAINAPMQGTAADIIKLSMINIDNWLQKANIKAKMIMQVHDELVFEVAMTERDLFIEQIRTQMIANDILRVPLEVDIGHGPNWDVAH